ncbi:MAG: aminotransferase class III-fold pyridoxal phosphate-dependent enzyme [Actinomycetota bacterium]
MPEFTDEFTAAAPNLSPDEAREVAERYFGVSGPAQALDSERDQNFRITNENGESFVLKIANPAEDPAVAEMQVDALRHVEGTDPGLPVPRVVPTTEGVPIAVVETPTGEKCTARMVTFLEGVNNDEPALDLAAIRDIGVLGARLSRALRGFFHPAAGRPLVWDIRRAGELAPKLEEIADSRWRELVAGELDRFEEVRPSIGGLRAQVVHNDLYADNVLVDADDERRVTGIIDFGDLLHAPLVCDLAVTVSAMMWARPDPFAAAEAAIGGFVSLTPLEPDEVELLPDLMAARLAATVLIGAWRSKLHPENVDYISVGDARAADLLTLFEEIGRPELRRRIAEMATRPPAKPAVVPDEELIERRRRVLGPMLPLSYDEPVHPVRGEGVWIYDASGRAFLDAYNNVPQVGHAHPRVVEALTNQARLINTNTRYLHESIVELSERLIATMPEGLDTCLYLNSGSEANDIAWRMSVDFTGNEGAIVTEFAYHGVTVASAGLSPEEWPEGKPVNVSTVPPPDGFRGEHRSGESGWAGRFAEYLDDAVASLHSARIEPAMCLMDSSFASDGIFFPPGEYLQGVVQKTHEAGGLFVADEVQAGFGRTGEMWSFAASGISPDFVALGKPMGDGHPVAAIVTRRQIAERFSESYPEFFSTFGGNTVSCAVALAVLDVLEEEGLMANAAEVGSYLMDGLEGLSHGLIGDIRGSGLMIGVELVRDADTREAATEETDAVVNAMRARGVLIGSTGPAGNVLKIRPPLPFSRANSDQLLETLDSVLQTAAG